MLTPSTFSSTISAMADIKCPGYNLDVLSKFAVGMAVFGPCDNQAEADAGAKAKAIREAMSAAMAEFINHKCPGNCVSMPIPKLVDSGAGPITAIAGGGAFNAFGWAKAQLDVVCIHFDIPTIPPTPPATLPPIQTLPGDIAPVGGSTRTR